MTRKIDSEIDALRQHPIPPCPSYLENRVLARIVQEKERRATNNAWSWLPNIFPETNTALAVVALVMVVSIGATSLSMIALTADRKAEINKALGFDTITMSRIVELPRE